jgi:hypothetical protein
MGLPERAVRGEVAAELSRRELMKDAGALGLGAMIASALPLAARIVVPERVSAQSADLIGVTQQAFFDTIIPGKPVPSLTTELGEAIHPLAIAGVDPEHGAVYTDALKLANDPRLGFTVLSVPFLAELEAFALLNGGQFIDLDHDARERTCIAGLAFANPTRVLWESAAAVAFTSFCAAGNIVEATGRPGTKRSSAGYAVMGHPGPAPHGYKDFSYNRVLNRGRTKKGYLP